MSAQAYQQYKNTTVAQADPVRLVALLYDGALRNCQLAAAALRGEATGPAQQPAGAAARIGARAAAMASPRSNPAAVAQTDVAAEDVALKPAYEAAHNAILKAYAIVAELAATLDTEAGGQIAVQLAQLYDYILHLLREADMAKSDKPLSEAEGLLKQLSATWAEAFPSGLGSVPEEFRGRVGPKRREGGLDTAAASLPGTADGQMAGLETSPLPADTSGVELIAHSVTALDLTG